MLHRTSLLSNRKAINDFQNILDHAKKSKRMLVKMPKSEKDENNFCHTKASSTPMFLI